MSLYKNTNLIIDIFEQFLFNDEAGKYVIPRRKEA
jgi:hypothetical protein